MKKLLITTDCFLPRWDGIARFVTNLIPGLKDQFDITIACPAFDGPEPKIEGVKIIRFPLVKIKFGDIYFTNWHVKEFKHIIKEHDIVFNQSLGPIGMSAILAAHSLKKPVVSFMHSIDWELVSKSLKHFRVLSWWGMKFVAKWFYNKCTLLLVPSEELASLLTLQGIRTKKQVVELGVDTDYFVPPINKAEAKKRLRIHPTTLVITYVGRLAREKNIETLVAAFKNLRKEIKNVLLLVVGDGIIDVIPSSHVRVEGNQNNVLPYYQASDIYVLPSLTETTSLTTLEAMACECAVVATPVGSVREYLEDGRTGLIFPRRDVTTLTDLLSFLATHEKTRIALGQDARKTIEQTRSWKKSLLVINNALMSL